jgi:adenylate cyclase
MISILVVDDEPDVEALLTQKFRRRIAGGELRLSFARDGQDALDHLLEDPQVDLVLADINMPRMDGLTLLARLQEAEDPIATVIVSAYGDMANIRTAMNRGAFDFLTKPIDFSDLEATVAKTIRHVHALRETRAQKTEAERAHAALARYFSPALAAALARGGADGRLAAARREISTLFTDIADFTSLAETLDPDRLRALLDRYLAGMCDIVFGHEGTVAKVMGDGLHILFGAPADQADHAERAVRCALDLDAFAEDIRVRSIHDGIELGVTRIGVHTGPAMVGEFGGGTRFEYTAYGDTINTAARLEAANKVLGTRICVSAATAGLVPGFRGRPIGELALRGRRSTVKAYEPLHSARPAPEAYLRAYDAMASDIPTAMADFEILVGSDPNDRLSSFHLCRLRRGEKGALIPLV